MLIDKNENQMWIYPLSVLQNSVLTVIQIGLPLLWIIWIIEKEWV